MENFIYDIQTKIYFGKNQIHELKNIISHYGKRVLLIYGGGSIKKNGIYDEVCKQFGELNVFYAELSGIGANPTLDYVLKGRQICKDNDIDLVLAIGGGSVIDCAKVIAASVFYEGNPWDLVIQPKLILKALPIVTVLTIAATGSEMDNIAVISNKETDEKIGTRHALLRPKASILDPTYTFSVSKYQTSSGVADILSHAMETYFSQKEAYFQDKVCEAVMKTVIHYGPIVVKNPTNYEARANIMWASSWAINDFIKLGKMSGWSVHPIEHQLSAVYDITHGIGLAILTPHWMEHVLNEDTVKKFETLAVNVWNIPVQEDIYDTARLGIEALRDFYKQIEIEYTLKDLGIKDEKHFMEMAQKAAVQVKNGYVPLSVQEIVEIYKESL